MTIQEKINLKYLNTFRVDCIANYFVTASSVYELKSLLEWTKTKGINFLILGEGSNILFTKNFAGLIIKNEIKGINIEEETEDYVIIKSASGENWDDFVSYGVKQKWQGIENLSLIPGTVGAAPIQNIGAYGMEVKNTITQIEYLNTKDHKIYTIPNENCNFRYRNSIFKNELKNEAIITAVYFKLYKNKTSFSLEYKELKEHFKNQQNITLNQIRQFIISVRKSKLPDYNIYGNAGSFFKNPIISNTHYNQIKNSYPYIVAYKENDNEMKISVANLIENIGWKDMAINNVATYKNQPLVIINLGNAKGEEVISFVQKIQIEIKKTFDINLEIEVNVY